MLMVQLILPNHGTNIYLVKHVKFSFLFFFHFEDVTIEVTAQKYIRINEFPKVLLWPQEASKYVYKVKTRKF